MVCCKHFEHQALCYKDVIEKEFWYDFKNLHFFLLGHIDLIFAFFVKNGKTWCKSCYGALVFVVTSVFSLWPDGTSRALLMF